MELENTVIEVKVNTTLKGDSNSSQVSHTENWDIVHNLNDFGLNIMDAFVNWSARLKAGEVATVDNFIEYVVSKDKENLFCVTKAKYDELVEEIEADASFKESAERADQSVLLDACKGIGTRFS